MNKWDILAVLAGAVIGVLMYLALGWALEQKREKSSPPQRKYFEDHQRGPIPCKEDCHGLRSF